MSTWWWIGIIVMAIAAAVAIAVWLTRKHDTKKVSFMMDALEDGELNFRFKETSSLNRALNRIRGIFERRNAVNEEASWSKLFRVMTHEIMNTVAPIASLSDALLKDENLDAKEGLETIAASSKDLIRFVDSYRNFTQTVPLAKKVILVDELMDRVLRLNRPKLEEQGVTLTYSAKTPDLLIYADDGQLMQVFNNMIKNAVQAGAVSIWITGELNQEDQTVIRIANNGKAIPLRQHEEIFVPFYTTKPNGTGIGLSLSKQIMVRNNGTLVLEQSDNQRTIFALVFR
ncbi:MAG: HAMP domain-containing histidine kinase [Bacteroidales bacterium]|nr:HAMP domain-containing histidine kinase [Bacteroidales bacterium]